MQMRPDIQIQGVIKAITEVLLPAMDPQNKLAQEQARLCIGTLSLMAKQLPLQFRFDCDELSRLLAFSQALREQAGEDAAMATADTALARSAEAGAAVLERAKARPDEVLASVRELRATSAALVTAVFASAGPEVRDRVKRCVLAMSAEQLLRDRSWLAMQAWEPDPKSLPDIRSLLGV